MIATIISCYSMPYSFKDSSDNEVSGINYIIDALVDFPTGCISSLGEGKHVSYKLNPQMSIYNLAGEFISKPVDKDFFKLIYGKKVLIETKYSVKAKTEYIANIYLLN